MRVVFMGTPEFAAVALRALIAAEGHEVVAVVSQPDRKAGRGKKLTPPPVAEVAKAHGIPLNQVETCRTRAFRDWVASHSPDIGVVAAFGHILGPKALAVPTRGCLNIHASLLPRWRGAAPIQASILAGDAQTGVTIMQMDPGLDTGPMLAKTVVPITDDDTASSLHDKLAASGAAAIVEALDALAGPGLAAEPQPNEGATYAEKLAKADGVLDWTLPSEVLHRRVRAFHPWPGTSTTLEDKRLKVHPPVGLSEASGEPGTVLDASPGGSSWPVATAPWCCIAFSCRGTGPWMCRRSWQGISCPPGPLSETREEPPIQLCGSSDDYGAGSSPGDRVWR